MNIGLMAWELEQKEMEFNTFLSDKIEQLHIFIEEKQKRNNYVIQSIYYEHGKFYVNYIESYPYGRLISHNPMEYREFLNMVRK